jgi:transcriptional regulator with XRE-family HTH domain
VLFRRIRDDAGIGHGGEAARRVGVTQATISRWESGKVVPTVEQASRYAEALSADPGVARELVTLITDLRTNHQAGRSGPRGGAAFQNRVHRLEAAAGTVAVWHPLLVPGALQTEAYARAVFGSGDLPPGEVEARTAARLQRGALLAEPSRQYTFITTWGALGWRAGEPETMARQVDHLADVSQRPNVRLGVIPWGVEASVYPSSGFELYDGRTVAVGSPTGARFLNEPTEVARYVAMLGELANMAAFDDAAREVLFRAARDYRQRDPGATP